MAFTYRNPLEIAINKLPSKQSDQLYSLAADQIEKKMETLNSLFSFSVTPEVQELLVNAGVQLAPLAFNVHSHPACKMIENHILYVVIPNLLKEFRSVAFFSLRPSKVERFLKMYCAFNFGKIKSFGMYNALIDGKDSFRYGETSFNEFKDRVDSLRDECLRKDKFPKVLFLHDELHFLEPLDIAYLFEQIPEINRVIATTVFPIEILRGDERSKEPRLYTLRCKKYQDRFFYFPDGKASEGYEQKISSSSWPFKYSCIRWFDKSVRVSKLYSLFSHHVFSFDRGRSCNNVLMFNKPSCLLREEMRLLTKKFDQAVVERKTVSSLCTYLSCLKSPNAASAVAKLRQLEKRELYPDELSLVYSFGNEMAKFGLRDEMEEGLLSWVKDTASKLLPDFVGKFFFDKRLFQQNVRELNQVIGESDLCISREVLRLDYFTFTSEPITRIKELAKVLGVEIFVAGDSISQEYSMTLPPNDELIEIGKSYLNWDKVWIRFSDPIFYRTGARSLNVKKNFLLSLISNKRLSWQPQICYAIPERPIEIAEEVAAIDQIDRFGFHGGFPDEFIDSFRPVVPELIRLGKRKRKNDCVFKAISHHIGCEPVELMEELLNDDISDELMDCILDDKGLSHEMITEVLVYKGLSMYCTSDFKNMFVLNRKFGFNGKLYCTIKDNHCELSCPEAFKKLMHLESGSCSSGEFSGSMDHLFDLGIHVNGHEDVKRLAKSMNRGTTGVLKELNPDFCSKLCDLSEIVTQPFSHQVGLRMGFAGSGKSREVIKWINMTSVVKRCFISPRRALADDVKEKLKGTNCSVFTFESALTKVDRSFKEIILDEISLYPPGYVGLLQLAINRKMIKGVSEPAKVQSWRQISGDLQKIYCIGDPLQVRYHCAEDTLLLGKISDIDMMVKAIKYRYLWQAYRFGTWFGEIFPIKVLEDGSKFERKFHPDVTTIRDKSIYDIILCPNQEAKRNFNIGLPVMTYGESQGLTFDKKALIVLNDSTFKGSIQQIIVALTRSRTGFDFVLNGMTLNEVQRSSQKGILSFVFEKKQIPMERFVALLGKCDLYSIDASIGNEESSSIQDKAMNDPFIMPFINLAEEDNESEEINGDVVEAPEWFKCHLPIFDCDPMLVEMFEKVEAKEKREFQSVLGMSNQFLDLEKRGSNIEVFPFSKQNIFPHHQSSDDVTFWEGVKKRIRKSNWRVEWSKLEESMPDGKSMVKKFLKMLPNEFKVNIEDIDFGEKSFIEKRKQKAEKMWEAHKERSDIDWNLDHVFLFMKSQFCTKEGKMFTEAKAGQTLACFQHIVLFRFGPMLRAIEKAFVRACGESFYIHSGKNFMCLDAFVTNNGHLFQGESIESDYTAFDSSQDHVVLAFEVELLRHLNINEVFIRDYIKIKLSLGSRIGELAIMRFTGEFCTFLFNTFANMLFTTLKYKIDHKKDRILFAGDDMCSIGSLKKNNSKESIRLLSKFSLKAVEEVKKFPMFCGWYLSPDGILKSPRLLWARIIMMVERNLISQCVDNYLFEAIFAYRLGERLYSILKEEDFEYHYLVIRYFVRNSRLLKGASKQLITEIGEGIGSCQLSMSTNSFLQLSPLTSRLTLSSPLTFTRMRTFCIQRSLIASSGLNQMSKFVRRTGKDLSLLISNSWTSRNCRILRGGQTSTSTYILESCLLELRHFCQTLREWVEGLYCMTGSAWKSNMPTLHHSVLNLVHLTAAILQFGQNIVCQQLQVSLATGLDSGWILTVQSTMSIMSCSPWILVLHIDALTRQDFSRPVLEHQGGLHRPFLVVNCLNSMVTLGKQSKHSQLHSSLKNLDQMFTVQNDVGSCRIKLGDLGVWLQRKTLVVQEVLGPSQQILIDIAKMSLETVITRRRKRLVGNYLWTYHINRDARVMPEPAAPANVNDVDDTDEVKISIKNHYFKYLFGNIAVFGSSNQTVFPTTIFSMPEMRLEGAVQVAVAQEEGAPAIEAQARMVGWDINLANVVAEIKTFCRNSTDPVLDGITFRQVCEAFAESAYMYLQERWTFGQSTRIYRKWPKALTKAPWVAFDFASGLNMSRLSEDERSIVDRMTKRVFRTEGQKSVFEAGSEVNLDLEG